MPSIAGNRRKYQRVQADLNKTREKELELIGLDGLALLKARVINTGIDADGKPFPGYSEAVVPYYYYADQDGVSDNDVDRLLEEVGYFASYKDLRDSKGLPTNIKNFSFTNEMWNKMTTQAVSESNGVVVIEIRTSNKRQDVLSFHVEKYDLLKFGKEEKSLMRTLGRQRVEKYLRKNGLL